ncbi:hypothetical protein DXT88_22180 [Herbaspirillum lusitanum]|uniref:hypothetical protein n=1 Tax=Herbaspirillum lusitanum TaxID=213312 RepID=UPI002238DC36|nr:hypothetical protein [Herbaspirillum lusitanum]MCW5300884.1 hypothetical protein [Herbaspirillum lusitanum]
MPLPTVTCPNCRVVMSMDLMLTEDAPRDALHAIIDAHPAGNTFIKPLLRYVGLFAPEKSQLNHRRMAALINELVPSIRAAQVERNGRTWACPIAYWQMGFEQVLAQRDAGQLRLPLKSHGYLFEVLAGMANRAEGAAEKKTESQRAGHAGQGSTAERRETGTVTTGPVVLNAALPKQKMPDHVLAALKELTTNKKS